MIVPNWLPSATKPHLALFYHIEITVIAFLYVKDTDLFFKNLLIHGLLQKPILEVVSKFSVESRKWSSYLDLT